MTPQDALHRAIRVCGTQTALADGINEVAAKRGVQKQIKTGHIHYWLNNGEVPAEHAPDIEQVTRDKGEPVSCEQLCPSNNWAAVRGPWKKSGKEKGEHAAAKETKRPTWASRRRREW